jgi:2-keto-4-pentenoate hydratase/2-oxohepta-3-ene-1,7-dioic acid hydratase in catechol pathway
MKIFRVLFDKSKHYDVLNGEEIQLVKDKPFPEIELTGASIPTAQVKLMPPCEPSKIIAMGLNYYSHAREMGCRLPNSPLTFLKPPTAIIGPHSNIVYPSVSARVDYEGELAVVIKKVAWRVDQEQVPDYILGYSCFNDVTARDLQQQDSQWTRAKGFDTFAAVGPWIETDLQPDSLEIETRLNGEIKQQGNTQDMIYSIPEIINFISNVMTLMPGDIIATGTPAGIGPMFPGDQVDVIIAGLGTLTNYVISNGVSH